MPNLFKNTAAALVLTAMSLPIAAFAETNADTVVATVNGADITVGHMIAVRETLPQQYTDLPDEVLFQGILDQLVQQEALRASGDQAETKRLRITLENERRALMADQIVSEIASNAVTEEAVQAAYEESYANLDLGKEYNASHILVASEDEAKALIVSLNSGADFAELAREKSTGPSGEQGGQLGWFGPGMMVPEFEQAVMAMEKETVSAPVQTQFGWHVIRLNDSRERKAPELEQVREELEKRLQQQAVETRINELMEAADVTRVQADEIDAAGVQQRVHAAATVQRSACAVGQQTGALPGERGGSA